MIDSFLTPSKACLICVLATVVLPPGLDLVATRSHKDGPAFGISNADSLILVSFKFSKRFLGKLLVLDVGVTLKLIDFNLDLLLLIDLGHH